MKTCTKCNGTFDWKLLYDKTKIPCGDNPCTCPAFTANATSETPPVEQTPKSPKVTPTEILGEIAVFYELYKDVDPAKFESMAKIYISRNMAR